MATSSVTSTIGDFDISTLETQVAKDDKNSTNALGMMYRSSAGVSTRAKELGDQLALLTKGEDADGKKLDVDNPLTLARITAASGNYNMARQLQSNLMKSIKDTASAIIRNV
ncbi:EscF/YscF/HrpA family type III secretion system needle major subunit [Providencia manganoxydans]|uniref:EscF/YscF/HrpA family type III secretion system needle major subunit n=1 Tax=Providencia manganoxydans TaxID=2923283 RepID=UPI00280FCD1E|nr:type III secretion apparatus needle protein [Providencia stuartii]ELR5083493.1 type III secretion apparatus needle protein [Providencia stuartii]